MKRIKVLQIDKNGEYKGKYVKILAIVRNTIAPDYFFIVHIGLNKKLPRLILSEFYTGYSISIAISETDSIDISYTLNTYIRKLIDDFLLKLSNRHNDFRSVIHSSIYAYSNRYAGNNISKKWIESIKVFDKDGKRIRTEKIDLHKRYYWLDKKNNAITKLNYLYNI